MRPARNHVTPPTPTSIIGGWKAGKENAAAYAATVVVRTICQHCDAFDVTGPLGETRVVFKSHLERKHPDVVVRERPKPRRRRRPDTTT